MTKELLFYQQHDVEEYYLYDPDTVTLTGSQRMGDHLEEIPDMNGWVSPRLGIRFTLHEDTLVIYRPNGEPFLTSVELAQRRERALQQAEQATQRAERLADRLRELGVGSDQLWRDRVA